eukprot:scaffold163398_cov35-Tisochrysis_lutea.AAC.1
MSEDPSVCLIDRVDELAAYVGQLLSQGAPVAIDFEGVDLCREGQLCLVQLAPLGSPAVLVDVVTLGSAAFSHGRLKELLESTEVMKVGYDGRADSDALNVLGVRMRHFFDIQVLYCTLRDKRAGRKDRYLKGLMWALDELLPPSEAAVLKAIKEEGNKLFAPERGGSYDVWLRRPLPHALIRYAVADVQYLHRMRMEWAHAAEESLVLQIATSRIEQTLNDPEPAKGRKKAIKDW